MNTKFIRISVLLVLLVSVRLSAQGLLIGRVYNEAGNKPIPYAIIYIDDLKIGAVSDSEGAYKLKWVPDGTYLVSVQVLGFTEKTKMIKVSGTTTADFPLSVNAYLKDEVVVTGNSIAKQRQFTPQSITYVSNDYLNENSATNVIDAISKVPGVSAITDGQSISKPVIRGLGYNRVLTMDDGVEQMDQAWFDEFGIEADPDAVQRVEILKGPASLAYGSDAIAGVVNLIPEQPLPEGKREGDVLFNYQTNNGLINNMVHLAGTSKGISWSARVDNIMAHAYQDKADGYVLNSQFSNFNMDGTIGIHRKWGYSQVHASYFDMATGIVDGTRDAAGIMLRQVAYPILGGQATYVEPTNQEATSYTPFVINQRIRHTKIVWDNSIAVGEGRITGTFSYQKNQRQETNDPTEPNTPDIYYSSNAATYDLRYISRQYGGFNFSTGVNGAYQASQSLGTVMLIPNYNFLEGGAFAIGNYRAGKLDISGGIRYDLRTFTGDGHWIDTTTSAPQVPVPANTPGSFEEFTPFTSNYGGLSASLGATYNFTNGFYIKGNIAKGYRAPNVAECGADGVHDGTVIYEIGDPNLKPESNIEEDLTFGLNLKDVSFEGTVFNNSINDFIYAKGLKGANGADSVSNKLSVNNTLFPDAPVYMYTQGPAQLYGGEAMIDIHPAAIPWIDLYSSLSIVEGGLLHVPDSMRVLPFVPPARITVDLKFHVNKLGKGIKNAYVKVGMLSCFQQNKVYLQDSVASGFNTLQTPQQYAASQAATAGYTLFNAGIGGDLQSHGHTFCKIYISGTNLFNTLYMDYMSRFKYYPVNPVTNRVGVFDMGRNISIKIIIPFDFSKK